jgi:Tol biopolymer transport system component
MAMIEINERETRTNNESHQCPVVQYAYTQWGGSLLEQVRPPGYPLRMTRKVMPPLMLLIKGTRTCFAVFLFLTLAIVSCLCSCAASPTPAPTSTTVAASEPASTSTLMPTPAVASTATAIPTATVPVSPALKGATDAFAVDYFPWADQPAEHPRYGTERAARVINSIYFEEPPFFGFDINPLDQWYHVIGVDHWAVMDGLVISPMFNPYRQPRDQDAVQVHGHVQGEFITASYVGLEGDAPYYYRSLLHVDELQPGVLPTAYDGLEVWIRGVVDAHEGEGGFYRLPEGASFDPSYLGREALVAGRLEVDENIWVNVSKGIYVKQDNHYIQIVQGLLPDPAAQRYERGIIRILQPSRAELVIENAEGQPVEIRIDENTRFEFANGDRADPVELAPKQEIEVIGQAVSSETMAAIKVTIFSTTTAGKMYAGYLAGPNDDLWIVSLDGQERRQITHLTAPADGLSEAEFSPDGLRFAFAHKDGDQSSLIVGDLLNGGLRDWLADDQWQESDPSWSPEGSRLAFCRYRLEGDQLIDGALCILTLNSGSVRRVTGPAPQGWQTIQPRWSPDGKHIAFGHVPDDPAQMSKLYVLSFPPQSQWMCEGCLDWRWAMDSTHLTATRQLPQETRARIWIVQWDGTSPTWLSDKGRHDQQARWAPDGTAIAFLSRPAGAGTLDSLWIMQADGLRKFQPAGGPYASSLAWSPDGQHIVFMRGSAIGANAGLWLVNRDGSGLRQLATDASALVGTFQAP